MKRLLFFATVVVLLSLSVAACAGGPPAPTPTPEPTATPEPPTATATPALPTATPTPSADDHVKQGKAYYKEKNYKEAIAEFQAATELEADNAQAYVLLGNAYERLRKHEDAIVAFKQAISIDSENGQAYTGLCGAYALQNMSEKALEACKVAQKLNPNDADTFNGFGIAYYSQGRIKEAIAAFQQAVRLDPQAEWAHNNLGRAYAKQGELEKAKAELETALRINPRNASAHANMGYVLGKLKQYDKAVMEYQQAIKLDPNLASTHLGLASVYTNMGKYDEAIAEYETVLVLRPDYPKKTQIEAEIARLQQKQAGQSSDSTFSSVHFEDTLPAGKENRVPFLSTPGGAVVVRVKPEAGFDVIVGIQDALTGKLLTAANSAASGGEETLTFKAPVKSGIGMYRVAIGGVKGSNGSYDARIVGSSKVSLSMLPQIARYTASGQLAKGASTVYLYSGKAGTRIAVAAVPSSKSKIDLRLQVMALKDLKNVLAESNRGKVGENESLSYVLPDTTIYVIKVSTVNGKSGLYSLAMRAK